MSSRSLVGSGQALKTMGAKGHGASLAVDQPCPSFSRIMRRFSKVLLTIYLAMILAYAVLQPFVSQSILSYLKAIGVIES